MQVIENKIIKEKLYLEELENGLKVIVIPKKDTNKKMAIIGTKFGSVDNHFIKPQTKEEIVIPDGVAHFLEHKMFEQANGTNSLDTLTAMGVEANAYTTNDHTAYYFEAVDNFEPAFKELLDYLDYHEKEKILLIGDSLHSEVQGGKNAGIDTCWYNREQNIAPKDCTPTIEIHKLKELTKKL